MYSILICDDEKDIVSALKIYLSGNNYELHEAYSGVEAVDYITKNSVHLILMDIMMPGLDGISALARIREISNVPVILLTAKSEDSDKITGLNVGADDYITKPFNPAEVIARVKSQLRRYMELGSGSLPSDTLKSGGIELDDSTKTVRVDGEEKSLTPTEFEILKLLMKNPGRIFSPDEIYRAVWNGTPLGADNTVAVHIRHLREKIEINPTEPRYVRVVWGQGYKMEAMK